MAGLLDLAGGALGGPMGAQNYLINGSGNGPGYQQTPLDSGSQKLLTGITDDAGRTPEQQAHLYLHDPKADTAQARGFLPGYSQTFGMDPAIQGAIQNRANRNFDSNYNALTRNVQMQAPIDLYNKAGGAFNAASNVEGGNLQNAAGAQKQFQDQTSARAQALSSVFGAYGKIGGVAAGGGFGR